MAGIILRDLYKRYPNGFEAVHHQNLEVNDGEFVVLVGPSGCGKSTTLRLIAGLEEVTSGEIRIGERLVNELPPAERDIAMVFQNYALYPHMTVFENMAFALRMRKAPQEEVVKRVQEAARILSIEPLLERRPREMSGGQRQRVALGRAIVRNPAVFLFDEPLSNLDAKLRVQMRTEIARLHRSLGTTMIYVTHDQVEAMTLGDRIVVMNAGVIQQVDGPLQLYEAPANRFVAGFIGSPSMNFLPGRIEGEDFIGEGFTLHMGPGLPAGSAELGLRPEDLLSKGGEQQLPEVELEVVEQMGHESLVYFTLAGTQAVARLEPDLELRPGKRICLGVNSARCHLFAGDENGRRLTPTA